MFDTISARSSLFRRVPRKAICALVLGFVLPGTTAAMAAGPLDFLFKPASPLPTSNLLRHRNLYTAYPGQHPPKRNISRACSRIPPRQRRRQHQMPQAWISSQIADAVPASTSPQTFSSTILTLRPGDAVMTPAGIQIFEGPTAQRHSPHDLVPLANARNVQKIDRAALASIDVPSNKAVPPIEAITQALDKAKVVARAKPSPQKLMM